MRLTEPATITTPNTAQYASAGRLVEDHTPARQPEVQVCVAQGVDGVDHGPRQHDGEDRQADQ
jgi:hypothetical protein